MRKILLISLMLLIALSSVASALLVEIPNTQVTYTGKTAQSGGTLFSFVTPTTSDDVRTTFRAPSTNYFLKQTAAGSKDYIIGQNCNVGEYIVPYRCQTQWTNCQRIFDKDYVKKSSGDGINMKDFATSSWFLADSGYYLWDMYQCKIVNAPTAPAVTDLSSFGHFSGPIKYTSTLNTNDYARITGTYYAERSGPLILEGYIDVRSRQALAVSVVSSSSSCDGSNYWAGKQIVAVAGQYYNFDFTVKTPADPGTYTIAVLAGTGCYKDGGQEIATTSGKVTVKQASTCNAQRAAEALGRWYASFSTYGIWNPSSTAAQKELAKWGCTDAQIKKWCGTTDSDGDGIPDGCDYCPKDKGVAQDANGCHPCFGMDPYSAATKECYKVFGAEYGIDPQIVNIVNPVVKTTSVCKDESTVQIVELRSLGDKTVKSTQSCSSDKECVVTKDLAACMAKVVVPETPTLVDSETVCNGKYVDYVVTYSDGSTDVSPRVDTCNYGCEAGECLPAPLTTTCEGGRICGEGTNAVTTVGGCSKDGDCASGEFCLSGVCQSNKNYCSIASDCGADQFCSAGFCVDINKPEPEGNDGPAVWVDDNSTEPCTADSFITCQSGGSVTVGKCVDGTMVPTSLTCLTEFNSDAGGSMGGSIVSTPYWYETVPVLKTVVTEQNKNNVFTLGALGLVLITLGVYVYMTRFKPKSKGGKRK